MESIGVKAHDCYEKTNLPQYDFIITDIAGIRILQKVSSTFYTQIKCKLRVLDSFGTWELFNTNVCIFKKNSKLIFTKWFFLKQIVLVFWDFEFLPGFYVFFVNFIAFSRTLEQKVP